jgi:DNA-binding response OmpR family regulator
VNVLIIDDSEMALRFMTRVLSAHEHRIFTLPSPIGATRTVLRHDIQVVVIDVNLPSVRGDRLAGLFRANDRMDKIGVVLVSGMDRAELGRLAQEAGADSVVAKDDIETRLNDAIIEAWKKRSA